MTYQTSLLHNGHLAFGFDIEHIALARHARASTVDSYSHTIDF